MPIYVDNKKFASFAEAIRYVMRKKGWGKEKASAYVAGIEKKQRGKKVTYRKQVRELD